MSISRISRNVLVYVLLVGVILVLGFLSFVGMLALSSVIAVAIGAFFLAALIEGEVYRQNITQSLNKLFKPNTLKEAISQQKLEEFLKERAILDGYKELGQKSTLSKKEKKKLKKIQLKVGGINAVDKTARAKEESLFLTDYQKLQKYVHKLEEHPNLDTQAKEALETAQRQLKWQKQYFSHIVNSDEASELNVLFGDEKNEKETIRERIKNSTWLSRVSFVASLISGIGMFFVFLHVAPISIIAAASYFGMELSLAALPFAMTGGIYALGVIAGAGYGLLIYNALTNIVQADKQKWSQKIEQFFAWNQIKETRLEYISRVGVKILGISLVALIALCATVTATATWWGDGLMSAGWLASSFGSFFVPVVLSTIVVMGLATLCFNMFNALRAAKKLSKLSLIELVKNVKKFVVTQWELYFRSENMIQFINPFRFMAVAISYPFKAVVFLLHIIITGIAGDRFDKIPALMSAIPGAVNDGLVDGGFIFSEALEHHKKSHDHDHVHGDIPGWVLKIALFIPLLLPAAIFDSLFSQLNDGVEKKKLTVGDCVTKLWHGIEALTPPTAKAPQLNLANWRALLAYKIEQKEAKIAGKLLMVDKDAIKEELKTLRERVLDQNNDLKSVFAEYKSKSSNPSCKPFIDKLSRCVSAPSA